MALFTTSWSQKGSNVYVVFKRTNPSFNFNHVSVQLTHSTCQLTFPGTKPKGWICFAEINPDSCNKQQSENQLVLILNKKDPTIHWTALKKDDVKKQHITANRKKQYKHNINHDPSLEKDLKTNGLNDKSCGDENSQEDPSGDSLSPKAVDSVTSSGDKVASVTVSSGTLVTNGILKGGNQPLNGVATSSNKPSSSAHERINQEYSQNNCEEVDPCYNLTTIKHDWYETNGTRLVLTIYVAQLDPWKVTVIYRDTGMEIKFKTCQESFNRKYGTTSETMFHWNIDLFDVIVPQKCSHHTTAKTLVINITKVKPIKWKTLFQQKECANSSANNDSIWKKVLPCPPEKDVNVSSDDENDIPSTSTKCLRSRSPVIGISTHSVGYTGLNNMGNTCFMNSVLQALANTRELRKYFLEGFYEKDINTGNPLGMKGEMAEAFYHLLKELWSGTRTSYSPKHFLQTVGHKEPRFTDCMQHDAQEFMAFLLDILHEDVNRVKNKPCFEVNDDDSRPEPEVAAESWSLHKSRNDSFIVDLLHGMFKSKLDCPTCGKSSTKFDPFLFLPVPLPKEKRRLHVYFHSKDIEKPPVKVPVAVSKENGRVIEILQIVAEQMDTSADRLQMFEVFKNRIHRFYIPSSPLREIQSNDIIFIQEQFKSKETNGEPVFEIAVMQRKTVPSLAISCSYCKRSPTDRKLKRCLKCLAVGYCDQDCQKADWPDHRKSCCTRSELVGLPFILSIPKSQATYQNLFQQLKTLAKRSVQLSYFNNSELEENLSVTDQCMSLSAIDWKGQDLTSVEPLKNQGDEALDLTDYKLAALTWDTNNRQTSFVKVENKETYVVDSPAESDAITSKAADLESCLHLFTEPEVLSAQEAWYCPRCKEHREATKKMSIWQLPDVLILQFKRFSFKNMFWRDKIDTFIDFPIDGLDMTKFCLNNDQQQLYDLYAVVNHHGGIFGGHYTAFVRLPAELDSTESEVGWRLFDDSHVRQLSSVKQVVSDAAYVLMYKRRAQIGVSPATQCPSKKVDDSDGEAIEAKPTGSNAKELPYISQEAPTLPNPSTSIAEPHEEMEVVPAESLKFDLEPYMLAASFCGRNTDPSPDAKDNVTGVPIVRYNEIFDERGNVLGEQHTGDSVSSEQSAVAERQSCFEEDQPIRAEERSEVSNVETTPLPTYYTDMDAID